MLSCYKTVKAASKLLAFFLFLFFVIPAGSQAPRREFRAVWVATVANIDWPSQPGLSTEEQKNEIVSILDMHKKLGANAIILQVRPTADAIYSSDLEPWSRFLCGEQGRAPDPYYDPLGFWIEETHKRGMELHAWLNPYRINMKLRDQLDSMHVFHQHPEWTFNYNGRTYFSPANPQVWDFVSSVVCDVVERYDVDAIHFDDYFYPYQVASEALPDSLEFEVFGGEYYPDDLEAWRRHNVDTIIEKLSLAIKEVKPWVKFGISPFGVWRNREMDPAGSETSAGTTNYDGLYADVLKWQREAWIDYLMPQLYWREDHPAVGFSNLAHWWNDFSYGRSMYVGLAPYRIDKKSERTLWKKEKYFLEMIDVLRSLEHIDGFGYFSSNHFFRSDLEGLNKKLVKKYTPSPALVPEMPWIDASAPAAPVQVKAEAGFLVWEDPVMLETDLRDTLDGMLLDSALIASELLNREMCNPRFYGIYYYKKGENSLLKAQANLIGLVGEKRFALPAKNASGTYRISALDRLQNESQLSVAFELTE